MKTILRIIHFIMWNLSLKWGRYIPSFILDMVNGHCSVEAQLLQREKGGKIVSTVKVDQIPGKVCGHFMNILPDGKIVDRNGHQWHGGTNIGDVGYFVNNLGNYVIVDIQENFCDFGITSVEKLLKYTMEMHQHYCRR